MSIDEALRGISSERSGRPARPGEATVSHAGTLGWEMPDRGALSRGAPISTNGLSTVPTAALREMEAVARVMDAAWVPAIGPRIGLDPVIGLFLPGLGDVATAAVSLYLVERSRRLGVPLPVLIEMVGNVVVDTLVGIVPLLGDCFDVLFKANLRNVNLARRHFGLPPLPRRAEPAERQKVSPAPGVTAGNGGLASPLIAAMQRFFPDRATIAERAATAAPGEPVKIVDAVIDPVVEAVEAQLMAPGVRAYQTRLLGEPLTILAYTGLLADHPPSPTRPGNASARTPAAPFPAPSTPPGRFTGDGSRQLSGPVWLHLPEGKSLPLESPATVIPWRTGQVATAIFLLNPDGEVLLNLRNQTTGAEHVFWQGRRPPRLGWGATLGIIALGGLTGWAWAAAGLFDAGWWSLLPPGGVWVALLTTALAWRGTKALRERALFRPALQERLHRIHQDCWNL